MKNVLITVFLFLMLIHVEGFGQANGSEIDDALGFETQTMDAQSAPIDSSAYLLLVLGGCLGLWQLRKNKQTRV